VDFRHTGMTGTSSVRSTLQSGPRVAAMVVHCCTLLKERLPEDCSGLVVGCGNGDEVVYMRRTLRSERILGLDIAGGFSLPARAEGCVLIGDATRVPFNTASCDFAAAFHSLEHVGDPVTALDEVCRVLRPGAWFYLGVPNRTRLVGYLGSSDASTWQKITWNFTDWTARLRGKFRNELGAHAGFEREELARLLEQRFDKVQLLTEEFVRFKYAARLPGWFLDGLLAPGVVDYSAPAHYVLCRKRP
jgi:SAM-dependent methyltransferase